MKPEILKSIRETLPVGSAVKTTMFPKNSIAITCFVDPPLSEFDFEKCLQKQREAVDVSEFYIDEEGHHWHIFLKDQSLENLKLKEKILKDCFKRAGFRKGWLEESYNVVLEAMEIYAKQRINESKR